MMGQPLVMSFCDGTDDGAVKELLASAQEAHGIAYRDSAWFRWKFTESPHGPAIVCMARTRAGKVAGVVAFGRWRLSYHDQDINAGLSYETFVHPDFRGRGLFMQLAAAAAKKAAEEGIEILFNFPNSASRPGFIRLGWRDMGGIQTWLRPQSPLRLAAALVRHRGSRLGPLVAERASSVPSEAALPDWLRVVEPDRIAGVLSSERSWPLLRWRFFTHPTFRYETATTGRVGAVYRFGDRGGLREAQLMDLFPLGASVENLIAPTAIKDLVRKLGRAGDFDAISTITTPATRVAASLRRSGFLKAPNRASFLCLPLSSRFNELRDGRDWALTTTDIHTY